MHDVHRPGQSACAYAITTCDAYSFTRYGATAWAACYALLFRRGYNSTEAMAIMRSKLSRLAADHALNQGRYATSRDLARFLDSFQDAAELQGHVDDYVLGINTEDVDPQPDCDSPTYQAALSTWRAHGRGTIPYRTVPALRLVWRRP
jgi:hypothetical protein